MNINLNDKVIVVTGSTRGLGKEIAVHLANEGAKVVINYRQNAEQANILYNNILKANDKCMLVQADVSKELEVKRLYKEVVDKYGKIDVLINNAGTCDDDYIQFMSYEKWDHVLKTNLYSAFLCSRQFSKNMIKNHGGKIINIASLKGQLGSEGQCNYSASKAGMIGLTRSLAKEMGRANISVNAICPGFVETDMNRGNELKINYAKRMSSLGNEYSVDDLINFITVLCSDCLQGVSGQVFNLDSRIM